MSKKVVKRIFTKKGDGEHIVPVSPLGIEGLAGTMNEGDLTQRRGSVASRKAEETILEAKKQREKQLSDLEIELGQIRAEHEEQLAQTTQQHELEMEQRRTALERDLRGELENEFRERYEQAIKSLENAAADLEKDRDSYLKQIEQPALELVMETARQVLGQEIKTDSKILGNLIVKAFELLKPEEVVNVHIHPATFHLLLDNKSFNVGLAQAGFSHKLVDLDIDETIAPDQFKAELGGMRIEFSLQSAISELLENQTKELELKMSSQTNQSSP